MVRFNISKNNIIFIFVPRHVKLALKKAYFILPLLDYYPPFDFHLIYSRAGYLPAGKEDDFPVGGSLAGDDFPADDSPVEDDFHLTIFVLV